jgi:hypothetical protein
MTRKVGFFSVLALSVLFDPIQLSALNGSNITTLYSTGQGLQASGPSGAGNNPPGIVDPHWTLIQAPTGATAYGDDAFTITAGNQNVRASSGTEWIGPNPSSSFLAPPGNYTYQTTFSLAGFTASSAIILGEFAADNEVASITLNGVSVPLSSNGDLFSYTGFTISSGFVSGVNSLDFTVVNLGNEPNPTGLEVDFTSATASVVPEPTSLLLSALGLSVVACAYTVIARARKSDRGVSAGQAPQPAS